MHVKHINKALHQRHFIKQSSSCVKYIKLMINRIEDETTVQFSDMSISLAIFSVAHILELFSVLFSPIICIDCTTSSVNSCASTFSFTSSLLTTSSFSSQSSSQPIKAPSRNSNH